MEVVVLFVVTSVPFVVTVVQFTVISVSVIIVLPAPYMGAALS